MAVDTHSKTNFAAARKWARVLPKEDRSLFFELARNRPGSARPIEHPERAGFLLKPYSRDEIAEHVISAPKGTNRRAMLDDIISLVHQCSRRFSVYIGRTFLRPGKEYLGPKSRWKRVDHLHGCVLYQVPRNRILQDEVLAIALVGFWSESRTTEGRPALCCYNKVLGNNGNLSRDKTQLVYLCLGRKKWKQKVAVNHALLKRVNKIARRLERESA